MRAVVAQGLTNAGQCSSLCNCAEIGIGIHQNRTAGIKTRDVWLVEIAYAFLLAAPIFNIGSNEATVSIAT